MEDVHNTRLKGKLFKIQNVCNKFAFALHFYITCKYSILQCTYVCANACTYARAHIKSRESNYCYSDADDVNAAATSRGNRTTEKAMSVRLKARRHARWGRTCKHILHTTDSMHTTRQECNSANPNSNNRAVASSSPCYCVKQMVPLARAALNCYVTSCLPLPIGCSIASLLTSIRCSSINTFRSSSSFPQYGESLNLLISSLRVVFSMKTSDSSSWHALSEFRSFSETDIMSSRSSCAHFFFTMNRTTRTPTKTRNPTKPYDTSSAVLLPSGELVVISFPDSILSVHIVQWRRSLCINNISWCSSLSICVISRCPTVAYSGMWKVQEYDWLKCLRCLCVVTKYYQNISETCSTVLTIPHWRPRLHLFAVT